MASQKARLQNTAAGRAILHRTGTATELRALDGQRSLPPEVRSKITANPIPKHMSHELHEGRRKARVNRQRRQFKSDPYVQYVDVAAYPAGGLFAVAAVNGRDNSLTLAASVRAEHPAAAETIAAALVIKQHDRVTMRTDEEHSFLGQSLLHARGLQWKRTRSCVSYAFTANKFKQMVPYMTQVADIFVQILGEKADDGKEYPMLRLFQGLTMDYVGRAAFGFDCTFQRELTHPFLKTAQSVLPGVMTGPLHMLARDTTTMSKYMAPILWLNEKLGSFTYDIFNKHTSKVIQLRMKNPEAKKPDMLQTMLDVESEEGELPEAPQLLDADAKLFKRMSPEEVGINTTILFIAGFETTATGLSYLAYVLAKHQDVQENVREEVKSVIQRYVTELTKFLPYFITLILHYLCPSCSQSCSFTTRMAVNDFEYNGIKYKAGTSIISPTIQIHMDPRIWPEPEKFDPDRPSRRLGAEAYGVDSNGRGAAAPPKKNDFLAREPNDD
ncbi:hypothetical protein HPB49_016647 [Dermacentor silvarum]|uniref:Uncharacterized protein n=1 Tax=Dermacentor silvarum TaxID=543639 RepID=A0ACB8CSD8_DERSI|nr:hypothetical protein HPB49_016647 [Dermacentor silvarum]